MAKLKPSLADFYLPVIEQLRLSLPASESAPDLAKSLKSALEIAHAGAIEAGYTEDDVNQAQFAVVAWLDEQAMSHNWSGASAWRLTPLQRFYFSTTRAGSEFYQRLDDIDDSNIAVREVYALVLIAGFQGEKGSRSRQDLLVYARQLIEKLRQQANHPGVQAKSPLFPAANVNRDLQGLDNFNHKPALLTLSIIGIPLIIIIAVYFYFDYSLSQAVAALIGAK